jgi:hypothetical protein
MADLFMSYAREDRECAELLATALQQRGWTVWWDRQIQVGQSFSAVIERELDQARCVIVLWSQHSLSSDWVQSEAAEALRRRSLVPVRIEDVRPPLEFRRLQTADLLDWRNGFNSPDFDACIASIETLVGNTAARPLPSRKASQPAVSVPPPQAPPQQRTYAPPPPQPPQQQAAYVPQSGQPEVPNYLVPAVLVTVGCCLPVGIVAIVNASQVNTKLAAGDIAGARAASAKAKTMCWVAVACGLVVAAIYFVIGFANAINAGS